MLTCSGSFAIVFVSNKREKRYGWQASKQGKARVHSTEQSSSMQTKKQGKEVSTAAAAACHCQKS